MPYQNDMSTLADVIGPAYAAQQAGISNDAANQEAQAKANVATGTQQADIDKAGLSNLFTQAQTAQSQALTQGQTLGNIEKAGTLGSTIGAENLGNQAKMGAAQLQKVGQLGQLAGQVAGYMDGIPGPARPAAMAELLHNQGIDPATLGPLASGDPDMLRNFSQKAIQASAPYQQAYMERQMQGDTARDVANTEAGAHVQGAQITADARAQVAQIAGQYKQATAGLGALQNQLYAKVASGTATPQERAALDSINQVQQLTRSGSPFQSAITGTPVPANVPPVPGNPGAPAAPTGAATGPAAEQAAKAAFGSYEPDKYEYGINPATGNFGRRPKGQ